MCFVYPLCFCLLLALIVDVILPEILEMDFEILNTILNTIDTFCNKNGKNIISLIESFFELTIAICFFSVGICVGICVSPIIGGVLGIVCFLYAIGRLFYRLLFSRSKKLSSPEDRRGKVYETYFYYKGPWLDDFKDIWDKSLDFATKFSTPIQEKAGEKWNQSPDNPIVKSFIVAIALSAYFLWFVLWAVAYIGFLVESTLFFCLFVFFFLIDCLNKMGLTQLQLLAQLQRKLQGAYIL